MCGHFKRESDKQKVMRVFEVQAGLEEADFAPGDDLRPQSMQPVIYTNEARERQLEMMRWGVQAPRPAPLQCALRGHRPSKLLEGCLSRWTCHRTRRCRL
jgi:putative SOS response-associated peptidase YedK